MASDEALPVYLVHWNAPEWVSSAARSILGSDTPVAVTVVDNGPPSATAGLDLPDEVRVIPSGGNLGYAGGANVGLRNWLQTNAEWCVVGAHDLHVEPSDLRLMVEAGTRSPSFGILGPDTRTHAGHNYYAGELLGHFEGLEERSVMSGTCLLLRQACIRQTGLFDEQFGSYGEDDELCSRARRYGWKVGRVPGTFAHGQGTRASNRRALQMRNRVLLAIKISGKRSAAFPILAQHIRALIILSVRGTLSKQYREDNRIHLQERWYGLKKGAPLLWIRLKQPERI